MSIEDEIELYMYLVRCPPRGRFAIRPEVLVPGVIPSTPSVSSGHF